MAAHFMPLSKIVDALTTEGIIQERRLFSVKSKTILLIQDSAYNN